MDAIGAKGVFKVSFVRRDLVVILSCVGPYSSNSAQNHDHGYVKHLHGCSFQWFVSKTFTNRTLITPIVSRK